MEVYFYKTTDDNAVVSKTLTDELHADVTIRDASDVLAPEISIDVNAGDSFAGMDFTQYNYVYIPRNKRYYFITGAVVKPHGIVSFNTRVDVLNTYDAQIRTLKGTVDRQENVYNGYLNDNSYDAMCYTQIVTKSFPAGMTSDKFILMTIG